MSSYRVLINLNQFSVWSLDCQCICGKFMAIYFNDAIIKHGQPTKSNIGRSYTNSNSKSSWLLILLFVKFLDASMLPA